MQETYNEWTLVSLSPLPAPWKIAALVLVLVACALVLWSYRGARRRWWLTGARIFAALVVLGILLEPALQLRAVRRIKNRLGIVVDRSASMSLPSSAGHSRHDQLLELLQRTRPGLDALAESHIIEWFDLDGPASDRQLASRPEGQRTDLLTGLEKARDAGAGRPLAGLVLLSDGADNAELEGDRRGLLSRQAIERLERLGVPVNTVDVTSGDTFNDLAVVDVVSDEFAFVHNTLEIEVVLEAVGYASTTVPVTLRREGDLLATQEVVLAEGKPARVVFKTKPDKIGEFVYSVSVPAMAGEALTSNNERSFVLQVIRDKIRVLQVAGRPSWDERFLRQHLKENPNVDLISFFILRTPTDQPLAPESELSLIPFPVERLFTTELSTFDVVIFQNFDFRPYNMNRFLPNIRNAVRNGLGFVMIGGEQSFAGGGYAGTDLEEIIPIDLHQEGVVAGGVPPSLTEAGRRHPITDLARPGTSNDRFWQQLPGWTSFNRTGGLVPGATALAVHPQARGNDGQPLPLISVMEIGEGRSMALSTDTMWRWRLSSMRDGGASQRAYHRFWSNALRWLVRDPEHSRVQVKPERRRFEIGDGVDVSYAVRGADYQPIPFAQLTVTLEHTTHGVLRTDELTTGEAGMSRERYTDLPPGAYRVTAMARDGGKAVGQGQGVFVIESRAVEMGSPAPRPDLLEAMSKATKGGAMEASSSVWDELEVVDPEVVEVDRRRNVELWDNGWALALVTLLLAADWALRRRSGYL